MKIAHDDIELHCALLNTGYTHIHYEEYCYEYGDGESGPILDYDPEFDEYFSDTHRLIIIENFIELDEPRDIVAEYIVDQQFDQLNDQYYDQLNDQ